MFLCIALAPQPKLGAAPAATAPPGGYFAQYVTTCVVTLVILYFVNRSRLEPLNPWQGVVFATGGVLLLNLGILLAYRVPYRIPEGQWLDLLADVTTGGWVFLFVGTILAYRHRRTVALRSAT